MLTKQKKLASCEIPREINTVKNWTQRLPFGKKNPGLHKNLL